MNKIEFVNVHGQRIDPSLLPRGPAKKPEEQKMKRVTDPGKAKRHYGFEVVGISEQALSSAAAQHAQKIKATDQRKRSGIPAFDPDAWLSKTKPKRIISRVFQIPEAAEQAAGMVRAGGGLAARSGRRDPEGVMA